MVARALESWAVEHRRRQTARAPQKIDDVCTTAFIADERFLFLLKVFLKSYVLVQDWPWMFVLVPLLEAWCN